jgi:hypothetical protein
VPGHRQQIHAQFVHTNRNLSHGLVTVGVYQRAVTMGNPG